MLRHIRIPGVQVFVETESAHRAVVVFRGANLSARLSDTDPQRTGMLPFVFDQGFGYERYADYALDVPMYFVFRDGLYIDAAGQSFRDFLAGRLPALPGELPRLSDWTDQAVVARARALQQSVGQAPIVVQREVAGFIVNRLQGALLSEAFRLVEDGYVSSTDVDKAIKDGLGLRWSFDHAGARSSV